MEINSSIGNSGLLISRTLHHRKHQLRDFFNRHACLRQLRMYNKRHHSVRPMFSRLCRVLILLGPALLPSFLICV